MCIFSQEVEFASKTNIFGRIDSGRQYLVYGVSMDFKVETSMILPVPIELGNGKENAVEFNSLEDYPNFFEDMHSGFSTMPRSMSLNDILTVHKVGCFEASYVPCLADFGRLDKRFRLPSGVASYHIYGTYGFVVFKFASGSRMDHPIAFSFPTRDNRRVFYPTAHVHDGEQMHKYEEFDYTLYVQGREPTNYWAASLKCASVFMNKENAEAKICRHTMRGKFVNADVWTDVDDTQT